MGCKRVLRGWKERFGLRFEMLLGISVRLT